MADSSINVGSLFHASRGLQMVHASFISVTHNQGKSNVLF